VQSSSAARQIRPQASLFGIANASRAPLYQQKSEDVILSATAHRTNLVRDLIDIPVSPSRGARDAR
jgi:hypothetical protein